MTASSKPAVSLTNVTLRLPLQGMKSTDANSAASPASRIGGRLIRHARGAEIVALDTVSFDLHNGDRVALIGHNGAGKSSLLRLIAGIYAPSSGDCVVHGRVSCLLSLGLGLNNEASLRENARLALALYGESFARADALTPDVLAFADLTEFADLPLHACSAGMRARLGFAIATSIEPDVFLVDEALGAGDMKFARQASERLNTLFRNSRVLMLSAHSTRVLREFCNKALWLEKGGVRAFGDLDETLDEYDAYMSAA